MEALDVRTLLAVTFKFTIIDPTDKYKSIRPQLQAQLDAAGAEWSTHLTGTATLEYNVEFAATTPNKNVPLLAAGAAKSAKVISTDSITGANVYQLGTAYEIATGTDPNGAAPDGGITIYAPDLKVWYFDPHLNRRNDPIPEGYVDGYSVVLHELAHSLGFQSARDGAGNIPAVGMYTYDLNVQSFGSGYAFLGGSNALAVYGSFVNLERGNLSHLGNGRFIDTGVVDQISQTFTFEDDLTSDLMGGVIAAGVRKTISRLDLAILKDAQTPVSLALNDNPAGIYEINGTGLSDVIEITKTNGTLLIRVNKTSQMFNPTQANLITAIVINGLNGNDVITINGDAPAVAINGGAGNDTIYGGTKGDSIFGGGGNDLIYGRGGGDIIRGGDGNDSVYGQGGSDRIFGDAGNDYLDGGAQTDRINGGGNADVVVGGTEDDFLFGDNGNDLLSGAGGKDRMDGGAGADVFYGGTGNDAVDYSKATAGVVVTIDSSPDDGVPGENDNIIDAENVIGSSFDDAIIGDDGPNSLIGGAGNDTLEGNGGNDTLEGNNGLDVLDGGGGNDSLVGGDGNDRITGGTGRDQLLGGIGDDNFFAQDSEIDTVDGSDGTDTIGGDTSDILTDVEVTNLVGTPLPLP